MLQVECSSHHIKVKVSEDADHRDEQLEARPNLVLSILIALMSQD